MQLASDPAAKPPPPDCIFVAAPVVPSAVCLFPSNPGRASMLCLDGVPPAKDHLVVLTQEPNT